MLIGAGGVEIWCRRLPRGSAPRNDRGGRRLVLFRLGTVVAPDRTAERHGGRSLHWNAQYCRAGGIAPADQVPMIDPSKQKDQPPTTTVIASRRRGNLQHHVFLPVAPINIVYPKYSMLTYISAHPTAAVEIATALTGLAMTVVVVTWSRFAGGAAFFCGCTAERAMPVPYIMNQKSPVSGETGDFALKLFVPIRRAETSDRSGGFCLPYGSHNPSGTSLAPALPGKCKIRSRCDCGLMQKRRGKNEKVVI